MATWRPYLLFDPHANTVWAYISKIVQDRGLVTTYRKSYLKFHLALFSLTFSDLEKINPGHRFSMAYISKSVQDNHIVTIGDG